MYDYDELNELFDKGAYRKVRRLSLGGLVASFTRRKIQAIPLLIAALYLFTGDYISLLRHLQMVV
jgi:hypothetical protein